MRKLATTLMGVAAVSLASLVAVSDAQARAIEEDEIEEGEETILEDEGYIYLNAPTRFAGTFIRVADEEDIAKYREARSNALAEAVEDYVKDHERWQRRVDNAAASRAALPEEPIEPTDENFRFTSIERFFTSQFGPLYAFSKNDGVYAYMEALKPGTYIWYGPVFLSPAQGFLGQCYCMGTVQFEVKPGVITNLGNSLYALPRWEEDTAAPPLKISQNGSFAGGSNVNLPTESSQVNYELPASLSAFPSETPGFRAVGKINNFFGQMISRIAPIDGVIAYDRDTVIDVRAQRAEEAAQAAAAQEAAALEAAAAAAKDAAAMAEDAAESAASTAAAEAEAASDPAPETDPIG